MIQAKVTQEFHGVEDGKVYPRLIEVGEEITGSLAEAAIGEKWAKETKDSRAERAALDEEAALAAAEKLAAADAAAAAEAKFNSDREKLALLSHTQLTAIAEQHSIDLTGAKSGDDVIDAIQRALEALGLEVPAPEVGSEPAAVA